MNPNQDPENAPARVLFIMASRSYRAGAFLSAAQKMGVHPVVGSEVRNLLAGQNPDRSLHLDFQDLEAATDRIVEFARSWPLKAIISPDDDGLELAAMASDALGLSHNSVWAVNSARNKYQMRRVLQEKGLLSPWFGRFEVGADPLALSGRVPYPCVLKPLALSGSRGVIRADGPEEFVAAYLRIAAILREPDAALQSGPLGNFILVESYIPGEEVALEGIVVDGQLVTLAVFDKPDPLTGPTFEETIYLTPSRLPPGLQDEIDATAATGAAALGIREGPVHAEMRTNETGVTILEIAPRSIGGHCSRALRFRPDMSLEEVILRRALGEGISTFRREDAASGVMMIPTPAAGTLQEVAGIDDARAVPWIDEVVITIPAGSQLRTLPEGNQYLGFIFSHAPKAETVEQALRKAHAQLQFEIAVKSSRSSG